MGREIEGGDGCMHG
jgi:hypothetical protein